MLLESPESWIMAGVEGHHVEVDESDGNGMNKMAAFGALFKMRHWSRRDLSADLIIIIDTVRHNYLRRVPRLCKKREKCCSFCCLLLLFWREIFFFLAGADCCCCSSEGFRQLVAFSISRPDADQLSRVAQQKIQTEW